MFPTYDSLWTYHGAKPGMQHIGPCCICDQPSIIDTLLCKECLPSWEKISGGQDALVSFANNMRERRRFANTFCCAGCEQRFIGMDYLCSRCRS